MFDCDLTYRNFPVINFNHLTFHIVTLEAFITPFLNTPIEISTTKYF